jgi:hypothetical protein
VKSGTLAEWRRARADFRSDGGRKNEEVRTLVLAVALVALVSGGCSDSGEVAVTAGPPKPSASSLVRASPELQAKCRATANEVGYPVPCPTRVPGGLTATRSIGRSELDIIGPGGMGRCGTAWRGWVVGSSETNAQHLVVVASPKAFATTRRSSTAPPGIRTPAFDSFGG